MSAKNNRPQLGQRVKARRCVFKIRAHGKVTWQTDPWKQKPIEGIYIGYRDMKEGSIVYNGEDEAHGFMANRTVRVWLIVRDERRNPAYALPEDVSFEEPHPSRVMVRRA